MKFWKRLAREEPLRWAIDRYRLLMRFPEGTAIPVKSFWLVWDSIFAPLLALHYSETGRGELAKMITNVPPYLSDEFCPLFVSQGSSIADFPVSEAKPRKGSKTINPILATTKYSLQELAARRGLKAITLSGNGLLYQYPKEKVPKTEGADYRMIDRCMDVQRFLLFRGQRDHIRPTSPFVRALSQDPPPDLFLTFGRLNMPGYVSNLHMANSKAWELSVIKESEKPQFLPTAFHLLLQKAPYSVQSAVEWCDIVCELLLTVTLNFLSDLEIRAYVAHLTDYEMPVPILAPGRMPLDFISNPFVSTSASLAVAMLYASPYFSDPDKKFKKKPPSPSEWKRVLEMCRNMGSNTGFVYVIALGRRAFPITKWAGEDAIGANELEYAVSSHVWDEEVISVIPVVELAKALTDLQWRQMTNVESYKNWLPLYLLHRYATIPSEKLLQLLQQVGMLPPLS